MRMRSAGVRPPDSGWPSSSGSTAVCAISCASERAWSIPRDWASERKSAARMKPRAAIGIRLTTA